MRYYRFVLTILLITATDYGFAQTARLSYDTARIAIIPFEKSMNFLFDSRYTPATLTQADMVEIDSLFNKSIEDYNSHLSGFGKNHFSVNQNQWNYRRQYICVQNNKGQKEVYVNCFCETVNDDWKNAFLYMDDGGNCFFNFKLNLATKKYSDFFVNPEA